MCRSTRAGPMNAATPSTCPSVSGSSSRPRPETSQITFSTPSMSLSFCSISSFVIPGLRVGLSRQLSVVMSVPSPSTVIAPPSRIIGVA